MTDRTVQLVLHYDGAGFHGWQQQPERRTVQGVLEDALERLSGSRIAAEPTRVCTRAVRRSAFVCQTDGRRGSCGGR